LATRIETRDARIGNLGDGRDLARFVRVHRSQW
jgi:hypothetical protein